MKSKFNQSIFMALIATFALTGFNSCKKEKNKPKEEKKVNLTKSKKELLTKGVWILKETYQNDVLDNSNGTGKYEFSGDGKFIFETKQEGTYKFSNKDSTLLDVYLYSFNGIPMFWNILQLDEKNLKVEFDVTTNMKFKYYFIKE